MNKRVQLPFFIPMFAAYHNTAITGMALRDKPHAYPQLFNQCMDLICERNFLTGFSSPKVSIPDANIFSFPNIDRQCVCMAYAAPFYREIIRAMLDRGNYIYLSCVDDFYLPGKSWYQEKHMIHDGILYGYDDNTDTYMLAAYDQNWVFRPIQIPQESYSESIDAALEAGSNVRLTAIVVRDTVIEVDANGILKKLKTYLDSDLQKYPFDGKGPVRGIAVHDYLVNYFDKLLNNNIPYEKMDWRVLRIIWEYRDCMLKRIQALEEKMQWDNTSSTAYSQIVKENDRLRMLYAIYHKKRKDGVLQSVRDGVLRLKELERQELESLVLKLEGASNQ